MSHLIAILGHIDNWFKDLHDNPPIDQFSLKDVNEIQDEEKQLDSLAKDLELLLEDDESMEIKQEIQPEVYYFHYYPTEELALCDPTIGHCCTIVDNIPRRDKINRHPLTTSPNEYSVVMTSHFCNNQDSTEEVDKRQKRDLKKAIQTPMPRDHDYLAQVKQSFKESRQPLRRSMSAMALELRPRTPSVLNTVIMKRFARYSERLRVLSGQTCN